MAKVPFLLVGLLGENVAVISVSSLDLAGSGERKTLLRTGIRFHFRHFRKIYLLVVNVSFFGNRTDHHDHPLSFQLGQLLYLAVIFEFDGEPQQELLSLLREQD